MGKLYLSSFNLPRQAYLYGAFLLDWRRYSRMNGAERLEWSSVYPILGQRSATTSFDTHYVYQGNWALRKIKETQIIKHVDVGSQIAFVAMLSAIVKVAFIDIRPVATDIEDFESKEGNILDLPYEDETILSLSCLHVVEHIGLGRYGDPLNPNGTIEASRELSRVLAPGGNLYFSVPLGKPRVCFNAHRIHSPEQILEYFGELNLLEFSGVNDAGHFCAHISPYELQGSRYALGLFHFKKEKKQPREVSLNE